MEEHFDYTNHKKYDVDLNYKIISNLPKITDEQIINNLKIIIGDNFSITGIIEWDGLEQFLMENGLRKQDVLLAYVKSLYK